MTDLTAAGRGLRVLRSGNAADFDAGSMHVTDRRIGSRRSQFHRLSAKRSQPFAPPLRHLIVAQIHPQSPRLLSRFVFSGRELRRERMFHASIGISLPVANDVSIEIVAVVDEDIGKQLTVVISR